ncbi:hypothetical protein [Prevotella sp. 10(H)]|uniref:hypothetical protein n=1 Tax=Prevotella sp. 10(H) TaxID=1158294 RepID=UPI0004A74A34|nr:hypothetical protein [Prevotella sp. 10(H)]
MNVIFHVATGVGAVATLVSIPNMQTAKGRILYGGCAFVAGVIIHGILDYLPHCYPLSAKVDAGISLLLIAAFIYFIKSGYRLFAFLSFAGCIFPDIVDLLPSILNKYLNLDIPLSDKIFPWHYPDYSGSIFIGKSIASDINHVMVVLLVAIICWCRRTDIKSLFIK